MARAGLMLLKWLLIPVALAVAGYYFIGPRIGKLTEAPATADSPPVTARPVSTAPSTNSGDPTSYPSPDVTVSRGTTHEGAHPVTHHRHPKRKPQPKPDDSTSNPVTPPPDQGGSGGAATTTGGGDTGGDTGGKGDTGGAGG